MSSRVTTVITAGASSTLSLVLVAVETCTLSNLTKSKSSSELALSASCACAACGNVANSRTEMIDKTRFTVHSRTQNPLRTTFRFGRRELSHRRCLDQDGNAYDRSPWAVRNLCRYSQIRAQLRIVPQFELPI